MGVIPSLTLTEEYRLRMLKNTFLGRIIGKMILEWVLVE
jgi:hypothetical protein